MMRTPDALLCLANRRAAGDGTVAAEIGQAFQSAPPEALAAALLSMSRPMALDTQELWQARSEVVVPVLCAALDSRDMAVERRITAAALLADLCSVASCQTILKVANRHDTEPSVRAAALATVERLFFAGLIDDGAVRSVVDANRSDEADEVRVEVVKLAATSTQPWSVRYIEESLRDSSPVAEVALQALASHRHADASTVLARSIDAVPQHLRDLATRLRSEREGADARMRADFIVTEGRLLGLDDVNLLLRHKQYATLYRLLQEHRVATNAVRILRDIEPLAEESKNQRALVRKLKAEAAK